MLLIPCPWCGEREETEFHCGGESGIVRPGHPMEVSKEAFADYLFMRSNVKGVRAERWWHAQGCGRWFNALRDTVTDRFLTVYRIGDPRPQVDPEVDDL